MTYLEVVPLQVPLRWSFEDLRLREVKASIENVLIEDEVFTKTASPESQYHKIRVY